MDKVVCSRLVGYVRNHFPDKAWETVLRLIKNDAAKHQCPSEAECDISHTTLVRIKIKFPRQG